MARISRRKGPRAWGGAPGQPSRIQDRARVREEALEGAPDTGNGSEATTEREDKPISSQTESGDRNDEEIGKPDRPGAEGEGAEPQKDDDKAEDSDALANEGGRSPSGSSETDLPQDQQPEPLPRQDDPEPENSEEPRGSEEDAQDTGTPFDHDGEPQTDEV